MGDPVLPWPYNWPQDQAGLDAVMVQRFAAGEYRPSRSAHHHAFGAELKQHREAAEIKVATLAIRAHINPATLAEVEHGVVRTTGPKPALSDEEFERIGQALRVPTDQWANRPYYRHVVD